MSILFSWMTTKIRKCHLSLWGLAWTAFLLLFSWLSLCVSVSIKLWRDTLSTGLRARHHLGTTRAIAPISTNSFGATGTGEPVCFCFHLLYLNEPHIVSSPSPPVCILFTTSPFWPNCSALFSVFKRKLVTICKNTNHILPGIGHTNPKLPPVYHTIQQKRLSLNSFTTYILVFTLYYFRDNRSIYIY